VTKDFTEWHSLKQQLQVRKDAPIFQQQEIWWCSVGMNIGHEADGKSKLYSRPVLVVRKFNRHIFFGVSLTSRIKENPYYHRIHFLGNEQCVMLSQLRLWESRRLLNRMGKLPDNQFNAVRAALQNLL
jgi:mRNA-degrading endonuclease toxin of MazEF toxin-antitoxin module